MLKYFQINNDNDDISMRKQHPSDITSEQFKKIKNMLEEARGYYI